MIEPEQAPRTGRNESVEERMDRNWMELIQELRVLQTGVQILGGFLLTLPFQGRFEYLDDWQRSLYLFNVMVAALTDEPWGIWTLVNRIAPPSAVSVVENRPTATSLAVAL